MAVSVTAQIAAAQATTTELMVTIAAEAAARAMARAKETAQAAVNAASEAAAEVIADANVVAAAKVIAAAAAMKTAERMQQAFADVISAEVDANAVLAQTAQNLSEELTARREAEARLVEREAELAAFAAMVAHDLRAPLRAVSGFTTLLRSDLTASTPGGLDAGNRDMMDRILAATEQMRHLVDDQLTFVTARDRALNLEPVDVEAMIGEIVADLQSTSPHEEYSRPAIEVSALPTVRVDPVMCRQLLDNLIGNCVKYVLPGQPARIKIRAGAEPGDVLPVGMVQVEIADEGIGIPPGQHERLFASFHRAHTGYPGTGLGLAICRRIIDRHGGTITATDNPGGGSVFHFTLPRATPPTAKATTRH